MKPLTDVTPKPLLLIKGKPILFYIFTSLPEAIDEVFLVIQEKHKLLFEEFLQKSFFNKKVSILIQDLKEKGTYFALMRASVFLKGEDSFLVLNGDDIFLKEDIEKIVSIKAPVYGLSYKKLGESYRTCDIDSEKGKILSFRKQNKDELSKKVPCFSGALVLDKSFFNYEPVYFGSKSEAGIPHTLFANHTSVSFLLLKEWTQINTIEDLNLAEQSNLFK
jgi:NDP-sugar pyrophosphorylase family protein